MLEFGNVMRTTYGASVITSAYAASDSTSSEETEAQDIVEYLNDPVFTSYRSSAYGATEAIKALTQTEASKADSDAVVIAHLLQGDIAAQGQVIHNSQTTISMLQSLDAAAAGIIGILTNMATLATQGDRLASQAAIAETQIGQRMGYGMHITNQDLANQMAMEVISQMLAESLVVLQTLHTPDPSTIAGLLK